MTEIALKKKVNVISGDKLFGVECFFWWAVRICLVASLFAVDSLPKAMFIVLSLMLSFSVSAVKLLFPNNSFFSGLSLHLQSCFAVAGFFSGCLGFGADLLVSFPEYDIFLQLLSGIVCVAAGYYISIAFRKPESKKDYIFTTFLAFFISNSLSLIRKVLQFFLDFFTGRNLTKHQFIEDDHWFFRIFGFGMSPYEQRPLFDMNEDFIFGVSGSLIAMAVLYLFVRIKNKELFRKQQTSFKLSDNIFKAIVRKIKAERVKLDAQTNIGDILLWWSIRGVMIYAFITMENRAEANLLLANLAATFAVTLLHMLFPQRSVFCRISYKVQSLACVMVFIGSYCGNYVFLYNILPRYDLFLHFVSGFLMMSGGYYLSKTLIRAESRADNFLVCLFSLCVAFTVMPIHEMIEFIGDFIWGTSNQGFYWGPSDSSFFFKLFGHGVGNTQLYYLFDTMYDVLLAGASALMSFVVLFVNLEYKRHKKTSEIKNKETVLTKV